MARLSKVTREQASGDVREVFENTARSRGNIPNMFRIYAHRPEIMKTMVAHLNAITNSGTVPVQTKELVATLVSRLNQCDYWNRSHTAQAARHGASEAKLGDLLEFETGPFSEAEKAALAWARQMTLTPGRTDEALFDRLQAHYDEGEIVEITAMAGVFNYFNRVANSLEIEPTKPGEGL